MPKSDIFLQIIVFGMFAAIVGLFFIKIYPSSLINDLKPKEENPIPTQITTLPKESFPPTEILIPTVSLDLPVAPGIIANNKWTLYDDKVSWLSTSDTPGNGNVIIYGHNRNQLFGTLFNLGIGDEITIKAGDKSFVYKVAEKRKILPDEVDAIISNKQQLTLYTCDGTFDQKRLIVIAFPKEKTS